MSHMLTGLDQTIALHPGWLDEPFGLLANQASVASDGRYAWESLSDIGNLKCLFSPQHGLWAEEQANMIESDHGNLRTGNLKVFSLYTKARQPSSEMLLGLQRLVIDLQDVGTRVYTFAWSMWHCLLACAEHGIGVTILDRPNPLGGWVIEGPKLDMEFSSFVGEAPIPMRHGLTLGELACWLIKFGKIDLSLEIVPVTQWETDQCSAWTSRVRDWMPPSPNLPAPHSTLLYPGLVLLEGTNVSEGRGTTRPFELVGAPYIDGERVSRALNEMKLPGVQFKPVRFRPTFDKWQDKLCEGVWLRILNGNSFRPYATAVVLLATIKRLWPDHFAWRPPPYEYEREHWPIDIISGSSHLRNTLDDKDLTCLANLTALSSVDQESWRAECQSVWQYPRPTAASRNI